MTFRALAKALRRRQLRAGIQPKAVIHAAPDEALLNAYLKCARCQLPLLPDIANEALLVRQCVSVEEFVGVCGDMLRDHSCQAVNTARN